jgi:hypothetical protein
LVKGKKHPSHNDSHFERAKAAVIYPELEATMFGKT